MNVDSGQRLKEWRAARHMSQRELGSMIGVSQGYISDIEAGRSEPSRNFLQALGERFGLSVDWILTGSGPREAGQSAGFAARRGGKRIDPPDFGKPLHGDFRFGDEDFFLIERMDLDVSAGHGLVAVDGGEHEMMAMPRTWMMRNQFNPDFAVLVRVKGDSMAPTLPDRSLILLDRLDKDLRKEGIFAFNREGESFVKRLSPVQPDETGRPRSVKIISDNPKYPPDAAVGEQIDALDIVGRVRGVISMF